MADEIWLDVLPSMRGFGKDLAKQATKAAKTAGDKAGKDYKKTFESGADGAGDAMVKDLERAQKQTSGLVSKLSGDVSKARQAQARSAAEQLTAEQRVTDAIAKYGEESNQARAATLKLEAAREKAASATTRFDNAEEALRESQRSLKTTTEQLETAQKNQSDEVKKAPSFWDKLRGSQSEAEEQTDKNTVSIGKLAAGLATAAGGVALLTSAFGTVLETDVVTDRLQAALGATPQQAATYGEAAGNLWADAYGESITEVGSAVDQVVSSIDGMRDASQSSIEDITGKALALADAFDVDVASSARNAGILIKTGLAKDAEEAFDLMTASLQQVPAALRGEVADATHEYSQFFQQLGLDGPEAMGLLVSASEDGMYGIDKMGDALKELTIRSTDMSTASQDAYEAAGLSADDMANRFLAGGDTARGALEDLITGLQGIEDPATRANAAIGLFGTPLEDLGVSEIPAFLDSLASMDSALGDVTGAASKLDETLYDNTSTSLESLKRGFMDTLSQGIEPFLGPAESVLKWAQDVLPGITDVVSILFSGNYTGGLSDVFGIHEDSGFVDFLFNTRDALSSIADYIAGTVVPAFQTFGGWVVDNKDWLGALAIGIGSVVAIVKVWTAVTKAAAAVQAAFAIVLNANPIMLIVTAIAALVAGLVYFFTQTETGKAAWETFTSALATAWEWLSGVFSTVWETVLKPVFDAVGTVAVWLWENAIKPTWDAITLGWELLSAGIQMYWDNVLSPVFNAVGAVVTWLWENAISIVWTNIQRGWEVLSKGVQLYWNNVLKPVFDAVAKVAVWLWDTAIKPAWDGMKAGWSVLVDGITGVWEKNLKPAFEAIGTFVSETIPSAFEAGKDAIGDAWDKIRNLAAKPINFVIETVYNNGLRKAVNKVLDFVGGKELPSMAKIPAYAEGGRHAGGWALVGEEGPELVDFDSPARIYTANDTRAMLSGDEQAPASALGALAGSSPSSARVPVGGPLDWVGDAWDTVKDAAGNAVQWVRGSLATAASALLTPVRAAVKDVLPAGGLTGIGRSASMSGIDAALEWIRGIDAQDRSNGNAAYGGPFSGGMVRPSRGPVTSRYGQRWGRLHAGVDIAGGGPTYAAANGLVQRVGSDPRGGINILLNHGQDLWSYYAHNPSMSAVKVGVGDEVRAGQHIGAQGATGNATGVHLHFEVRKGSQSSAVDPARYIEYDNGGVLSPGRTAAVNNTGRPEYVFTQPQWELIESAAIGGNRGPVKLDEESLRRLAELLAEAEERGASRAFNRESRDTDLAHRMGG